MENTTDAQTPEQPEQPQQPQQQVNLMTMPLDNQNQALNVMVGFLNVAQRRGAYGVDEAARIWEAMKFFMVEMPVQENALGANTMEPVTEEPSEESIETHTL